MKRRAVLAALCVSTSFATAAAPKLEALYPAGAQAGTECELKAIGSFKPWPVEAWCSGEGLRIHALEHAGQLKCIIAKDAKPGPRLVRLYNAEGATQTRIFVIGTLPEQMEQLENNRVPDAQAIAWPGVMNGRLEKRGDADFFRLGLKKGQRLQARIDAYGLRSPIDPFLHVLDARGFELELASVGRNLDPRLDWNVPADGDYLLQVAALDHKASANVHYAGSEAAVYRLVLGDPEPDPAPPAADRNEQDGPMLVPPVTVLGHIRNPGARDRYTFKGEKTRTWRIAVEAHRHRSPLDAVFRIERGKGSTLGPYDDGKKEKDPEYLLKCSELEYTVEISERFRRAGPGYFYRLVIEEPKPAYLLSAVEDRLVIHAGKQAKLKLKLERMHDHQAELNLHIKGLPEGLAFDAPTFPEKSGELSITLNAAVDAGGWSGPLHLSASEGDARRKVVHSLQTGDSRGDYLVNEVPHVWLTLVSTPEPAKPDHPDSD